MKDKKFYMEANKALEQRVEELEGALKFYAHKKHMDTASQKLKDGEEVEQDIYDGTVIMTVENGQIARDALPAKVAKGCQLDVKICSDCPDMVCEGRPRH